MIRKATTREVPAPSPEGEALKGDCVRLAEELADLVAEKDHLLSTVIPNIAAQYAAEVGAKELEALRLDVDARRLKRILEHVQAIENRGDKANIEQIEASVEEELQEWHEKVDRMAQEVLVGKKLLDHKMTEEESAELRKLYRSLARLLHPDVNPGFAAKHAALWARVQQAYQVGNLDELRALMLVVEDIPDTESTPNAMDLLRERKERLKASVEHCIEELATIKASAPFELWEKLQNPEWVANKIEECDKKIVSLQAHVDELTAALSTWKTQNG